MSTPDEAREELDAICRKNDGYWPAIRDDLIEQGYRKQGPVTEAEVEEVAQSLFADWRRQVNAVRAALEAARKITNGNEGDHD